MVQTASSKILGSLLSTILGVSVGLVGVFITVLSMSIHVTWVALDAEATLYGFPLPWLSKALGYAVMDTEGLRSQIRAPPTVGYSAFVLDFLLYTAPLLALTYLLMRAGSHHRVWRVTPTLSSSSALLCLGVLSVLVGMIFVLTSVSDMTTIVYIDGEVNRYGFPLPWLSKGFGDAVIDTEGLTSQIRTPPAVDYQALLADLAFYLLPASAAIYGIVGSIRASQYIGRRLLWPRTRESLKRNKNGGSEQNHGGTKRAYGGGTGGIRTHDLRVSSPVSTGARCPILVILTSRSEVI